MISLGRLAMVLAFSLISVSICQAQGRVTGLFKISVESKAKDIPSQDTLLAIDKTDEDVYVVNLLYPIKSFAGKVAKDGRFEILFAVKTFDGNLREMKLLADAKDKKVHIFNDGKELTIKATAVNTGWYCGNHKPKAHIAFTVEEVARQTEKFGCTGWRQLNSADVGEFIKSTKEGKEEKKKGKIK